MLSTLQENERWHSIWEVLSQAASYIQVLTENQLAIDYQTSDVRIQTILIRARGTRLWASAFISQSLICPTLGCEWSLWWVDKGPYWLLCSRWMASHMNSEKTPEEQFFIQSIIKQPERYRPQNSKSAYKWCGVISPFKPP